MNDDNMVCGKLLTLHLYWNSINNLREWKCMYVYEYERILVNVFVYVGHQFGQLCKIMLNECIPSSFFLYFIFLFVIE